jgi:hypothetical protein
MDRENKAPSVGSVQNGGSDRNGPAGGRAKWVDVGQSATFQRRFLCPTPNGECLAWSLADLETLSRIGVDTSRWHIRERPDWSFPPEDRLPLHPQRIPPVSPLHAWIAMSRYYQYHMDITETTVAKLTRLFDLLLETGCADAAVLDAFDQDGCTPLIYSLRTPPDVPHDGPTLLPYRLLMVAGADATARLEGEESALGTALFYRQPETVVLEILGAHRDPTRALLSTLSGCVMLLAKPSLARAFLPLVSATNADSLFADTFADGPDFAGELVQSANDLLWRAITVRVPSDFSLPVRRDLRVDGTEHNWWDRDGLRAAIYHDIPERALWLAQRTSDDDLDAYDSGGYTVLMRAVDNRADRFYDLIIALLQRTPALHLNIRALALTRDYPPVDYREVIAATVMEELTRDYPPVDYPDVVAAAVMEQGNRKARPPLNKTAREMFDAKCINRVNKPFLAVNAAFESAQVLASARSASAKRLLACLLPIPTELRNYIIVYAALD